MLKKLAAERLVTLTGPGGVGKTRLAAEAAARLTAPAWFAELAPVSEPSEVPYAVLDALGLRERVIARHGADVGPADPVDRLCGALASRDVVLILDNCEHVVDAAALLSGRVLADCPGVRILATSREPLRIDGETLWPVSPLPVPPPPSPAASATPPISTTSPASHTDITDVAASPAVRLFRDRAAAVLPGFAVDESNADAVARICRALDGMPLAIELAAVWSRTLSPAQLAERLDDRFALLTGGSRTALPRHQTLRAVVDWSWNLLSEPERVLARRLSVFPAGVTLATAEQACADSTLSRAAVLPALSGLVGKSILTTGDAPGGAGRGTGCWRRCAHTAWNGWRRPARTPGQGRLRRLLPGPGGDRRPDAAHRGAGPAGSASSPPSRTTCMPRCAGRSAAVTRERAAVRAGARVLLDAARAWRR